MVSPSFAPYVTDVVWLHARNAVGSASRSAEAVEATARQVVAAVMEAPGLLVRFATVPELHGTADRATLAAAAANLFVLSVMV